MDTPLTDPLGNRINLTEICWTRHILVRHPIMAEMRDKLEHTIATPDFIYQSKIDPESHLYYKRFTHPRWGDYYLMAVVDAGQKLVKTAFPVYNLNKGKIRLWP